LISSLALLARIFEQLDLPVEVDEPARPTSIDLVQVTGHVRFEDVSFTYPGADHPALAGIDLDVPAASKLALAGEIGSGKTTRLAGRAAL
jgi:ATP-binding cassette subfamily B protein